jgi:hypothetical protein
MEHVIDVGKHVADVVVPILHRFVECDARRAKMPEVLLDCLGFRLPVFGVAEAITPSTDPCILER